MMRKLNTVVVLLTLFHTIQLTAMANQAEDVFVGRFEKNAQRPWTGPEYWTNPMEDWQISSGRLEVVQAGFNRNLQILTRQLGPAAGNLEMSVRLGGRDPGKPLASAGFRIGIQTELNDYRAAVFHGTGLDVGVAPNGGLFIGKMTTSVANPAVRKAAAIELRLKANPLNQDRYQLVLTAVNLADGKSLAEIERQVDARQLVGNLALVSNYGKAARRNNNKNTGQLGRHWFRDWTIAGSKVVVNEDQRFGPILFAMHTLSRRVMKMTAQMPPLGKTDSQQVHLELKKDADWTRVATATIHPLARTASFRIEKWDDTRDTPYRLIYTLKQADGKPRDYHWTGTIRRDPVDKTIVVAGFTGNTDSGFPNAQIAHNVALQNPDVLLFTGDQIYESVGGYGIQRGPVPRATINYLRKWYMFGWAFGDLMRDRVTLCLPDDHDVYQGNIWGNGGNAITMANHPRGGYAMPAEWVNMIQRTQSSHHPDPYDATPIKQGITVYYGDMVYGRVSFAIIEDRKFKSGPQGLVKTDTNRPDHIKGPDFDPASVDVAGAVLLGERQLKFLRDWAADWRGAEMKVVCSQTIFCNVANYHGGNRQYLTADLDSNGWPQAGRNRALREIRKGFALMYAGDQHLPSIVHHGIDTPGDAGYSFCVPSIAAGYPRSWLPDQEGQPVRNRPPGGLANTGEYLDGLGNRVTVHAIGNPEKQNRRGVLNTLHDKSSGFGIVRFDKKQGTITMECWRLLVDVSQPKPSDQFPGWPKTIHLTDNYGRKAIDFLPTLEISGMDRPVIQVIDEANDEVVYTLRVPGNKFQPGVFKPGTYTVRIGNQQSGKMKKLTGLQPARTRKIRVKF